MTHSLRVFSLDEVETAKLSLRSSFFYVRLPVLQRIAYWTMRIPFFLLNFVHLAVMLILFAVVALPARLITGEWLSHVVVEWMTALFKFSPGGIVLGKLDMLTTSEKWGKYLDSRPRILYLRPFKMDNRKILAPPQMNVTEIEFEPLIRFAANRIGPVVALGREIKSSGLATRLTVEDDKWQPVILRLLQECANIIAIPEDTLGTLWEIDKILESPTILHKTVFMNLASAGVDHKLWKRDRLVYGDDGTTFKEVLQRIANGNLDNLPPSEEILCAFVHSGHVNLICSQLTSHPGNWMTSPLFAMFLKMKILTNYVDANNPMDRSGGSAAS